MNAPKTQQHILTPRQCAILLQTTGLDRSQSAYRNCFITPIGGLDDYQAGDMADAGLMTCEVYELRPHTHLYKVTPDGLESARAVAQQQRQHHAESPRSPFDVGARMSLKGARHVPAR